MWRWKWRCQTSIVRSPSTLEVLGFEIFHDDRKNPRQASVKGVVADFGVELAQSRAPVRSSMRHAFGAPPGSPCLSFSVSNLDEAFEGLKARGWVDAAAPSEIRGVRFFYLFDPDGQPIELHPVPLRRCQGPGGTLESYRG